MESLRSEMRRTSHLLYAGVFCLIVATILGLLVVHRQGDAVDVAADMGDRILQKLNALDQHVQEHCP